MRYRIDPRPLAPGTKIIIEDNGLGCCTTVAEVWYSTEAAQRLCDQANRADTLKKALKDLYDAITSEPAPFQGTLKTFTDKDLDLLEKAYLALNPD